MSAELLGLPTRPLSQLPYQFTNVLHCTSVLRLGEGLKRESAELLGPPTRPLAVKFRSMMAYMAVQLMELWGGRDCRECAAKMLKAAAFVSGGIEMG